MASGSRVGMHRNLPTGAIHAEWRKQSGGDGRDIFERVGDALQRFTDNVMLAMAAPKSLEATSATVRLVVGFCAAADMVADVPMQTSRLALRRSTRVAAHQQGHISP